MYVGLAPLHMLIYTVTQVVDPFTCSDIFYFSDSRDLGWVRLLDSLRYTHVADALQELSVVCYSTDGLDSLINFIRNSNLRVIRYGRRKSKCEGGCINDNDEAMLWKTLTTSGIHVEEIYLYYDSRFDQIDLEASVALLKQVILELGQHERDQLNWKRIAQKNWRDNDGISDMTEFNGLVPSLLK